MGEPNTETQINFDQDQAAVTTTKWTPQIDTAIFITDNGHITHRKIIRVSCWISTAAIFIPFTTQES